MLKLLDMSLYHSLRRSHSLYLLKQFCSLVLIARSTSHSQTGVLALHCQWVAQTQQNLHSTRIQIWPRSVCVFILVPRLKAVTMRSCFLHSVWQVLKKRGDMPCHLLFKLRTGALSFPPYSTGSRSVGPKSEKSSGSTSCQSKEEKE